MIRPRLEVLLTAAAAGALILSGCGGGDGGASVSGEPLTISMTEYAFAPDDITIAAGEEVTLELVNDGTLPHEFMVGQQVAADDGAAHGFEDDLFAGIDVTVEPASARVMEDMDDMDDVSPSEHDDMGTEGDMDMGSESEMDDHSDDGMDDHSQDEMDAHGFMVLAAPGQTVTITFTLPADRAGEWTMGCFEQNGSHWTQGMQGTLTVTE